MATAFQALGTLIFLAFMSVVIWLFNKGITEQSLAQLHEEEKAAKKGLDEVEIQRRLDQTWALYKDQKYPSKIIRRESIATAAAGVLLTLFGGMFYVDYYKIPFGFITAVTFLLWLVFAAVLVGMSAIFYYTHKFNKADRAERKRLTEALDMLNAMKEE